MTSDQSDRDDTSAGRTERPTGLLGILLAAIDAFSEIETNEGGHRRGSGHLEGENTSIEYDYEVSIGLDPAARSNPPNPQRSVESIPGPEDDSQPFHVETRDIGEAKRVIIADLPETSEDELDIRFDEEKDVLELWAGGRRVKGVPLGIQDVTVTDITFNNQILEVQIERTGDTSDNDSNE